MLATSSSEIGALFAERFAAGPLPQVFTLDVIASVAIGVVVMNRLLDRMPRTFSHCVFTYLHGPPGFAPCWLGGG